MLSILYNNCTENYKGGFTMALDVNISKIFRYIQILSSSSDESDKEELNFYLSILKCFESSLTTSAYCSIEPLCLNGCSLEKAKSLATPLGLHIAEGGSGALYLSWSKSILEED